MASEEKSSVDLGHVSQVGNFKKLRKLFFSGTASQDRRKQIGNLVASNESRMLFI
jgi:hypothetical protein